MPTIPPDPDLRFADSDIAPVITAKDALASAADAVRRTISTVTAENRGRGVDTIVGQLSSLTERLNDAAAMVHAAEKLHAAVAAGAAHFRTVTASATAADCEAAAAAAAAARRTLQGAVDGPGYPQARAASIAAQKHFDDLLTLRETAVRDFEAAEDAALAEYQAEVEKLQTTPARERSGHTGTAAPATAPAPAPGADAPAPAAPSPGAGAGAAPTPLPATAAASAAAPDTAPAAAAPATSTGASNPALAALLAHAAQPQQQVQMPPQQPQPVAAPMPAMPGPQPQQRPAQQGGEPIDLDALLGPAAAAALVAPSPPPSLSTPPAAATISSPSPSTSGISLVNPSPSLSAAPAVNPIVTGTSTAGLVTDTNVTGRPDNAPPRTATSPAATHLAGATAAAAAEPGGGVRGQAAGAGAPMMPLMPMMGGPGMGGNGEPKRDPVTATLTPDQAELMGLETVAEAVPGGTIARKYAG